MSGGLGGDRLVVVGASLAGLRAVEAARRAGHSGTVTLIGEEPHPPYDRPPLSKAFLTAAGEPTFYLDEAALRDGLAVDLRLGVTATGLDTAARVVLTDAGDVPYDRLVVATGTRARTVPYLSGEPGVLTLRTLDDAVALRDALQVAHDVVVVGAGVIGAEVASSAREVGAAVTVVEAAEVPLVRAVGEPVGRELAALHAAHGVRLLCGTTVTGTRPRSVGTGYHVDLSTGESVDADVLVVGIGAVPNTGWLEGSGVRLDPRDGGVVCDAYLESSVTGVYAAGDVAHWPNALLGATGRLENWTNAAAAGAQAAVNAVSASERRPYETVPYFWSDWYGRRIQFVGTPDADEVVIQRLDDDGMVALYRRADRLVGVATMDEPRKIMKYRRFIAARGAWSDVGDAVPD